MEHLAQCDEVWHAGDIGSLDVIDQLRSAHKTTRLVWGNIDDYLVCADTDEILVFEVEQRKVLMFHIAGYPGRYNANARALIAEHKPDILVCGHSHILKVMYDKKNEHLHINPGACGRRGLHKVRTLLRFTIDEDDIRDMEVVELGSRSTFA